MAYIGNSPEKGNFRKADSITCSATATYNLLVGGVAVNPNQNQCIVSLNGVVQSSGNSYTIASSQITFASALTSSDVIDFILILGDTLDVGVPSDDSVGLAQLSASGSPSSSNFLRGDNSWAAAGTTINNNADNRVITGSGTANTLEGESNFTFASGVVNITSSDAEPLELTRDSANGDVNLRFKNTSGDIAFVRGVHGGHLSFLPNGNEKMRISEGGQVSIGTTETAYSNLTQAGDNGIILTDGSASIIATDTDLPLILARTNADNNNRDILNFNRNGSTCGQITGTNSTTTYATSSDYRLKENVNYDFDATTRLKQLKPARFNFIVDETNTLVDGFLAHEVSSIVPEAIIGEKDGIEKNEDGTNKLDNDGNTIPKYQGIDQAKLVPLLTGALQEAITKIETLETKVTALENK